MSFASSLSGSVLNELDSPPSTVPLMLLDESEEEIDYHSSDDSENEVQEGGRQGEGGDDDEEDREPVGAPVMLEQLVITPV
ncbi:hypothetical protein L873DRAFT_1782079 [Choiromyces venosus 120613-1]|uniref:Uncharacterized protein n=1 Tax=Choiromyces venosus 120613-1 TaxID=1336337 RepID=A0A3N4IXD2_9PEZI|nr:hypothetical protein L873DRAFT_1782079 [Choiromyces venosus 120613-1]